MRRPPRSKDRPRLAQLSQERTTPAATGPSSPDSFWDSRSLIARRSKSRPSPSASVLAFDALAPTFVPSTACNARSTNSIFTAIRPYGYERGAKRWRWRPRLWSGYCYGIWSRRGHALGWRALWVSSAPGPRTDSARDQEASATSVLGPERHPSLHRGQDGPLPYPHCTTYETGSREPSPRR